MLMEPSNPMEAEGDLHPAAVRGVDGQPSLFLRIVARGNYSRRGMARLTFNVSQVRTVQPVQNERTPICPFNSMKKTAAS
jgi:hypothetical protein